MRFWATFAFLLVAPGSFSEPQVNFCDLVRNPEKYNGKEVTVRATFKYGFEWAFLYCLDCLPGGRGAFSGAGLGGVWLEFEDLNEASEKQLRKAPKDAGIVNLTVQGVFLSGLVNDRYYGHENGYRDKFVARRVSNVVVLQKGMRSAQAEQKIEQKGACGGTNPK